MTRSDAARKGWETRKANEARRARRFNTVVTQYGSLRCATRALLDHLDEFGLEGIGEVYQSVADMVRP